MELEKNVRDSGSDNYAMQSIIFTKFIALENHFRTRILNQKMSYFLEDHNQRFRNLKSIHIMQDLINRLKYLFI
jgi:hypothetical protein